MPERRKSIGSAWLALCLALGIHVADEALTGFLAVYNPTVIALRERWPWLPMPVFRFDVWLAGLIAAVLALSLLSVFVFRGSPWTRSVAAIFAVLMTANALGHLTGTVFGRTVESVRFPRPMPGFYSSPLLLAASIYLLVELRSTRKGAEAPVVLR